MTDSDGKSDDGDSTHVGAAGPPRVRPQSPDAAPASGEDTSAGILPAPPRPPAPPAAAPPPKVELTAEKGAEDTSADAASPPRVVPRAEPEAPSASPPSVKPAAPVEDDEGSTRIARRPPVRLTHLKPAEHYAEIPLESRTYRLGRSSSADIRLYSAGASREHARLRRTDSGWTVEAEPGKIVLVDGVRAEGVVSLPTRARLRLGDDELRFVDETPPTAAVTAAPVSPPPSRSRLGLAVGIGVALLLAAALLALLVSR